MDNEEHLRLLNRVASGDRKAFELLYKATSGHLYAICMSILKNNELAEDVLQEGFIKIWDNAKEYSQGKGRVLTWMTSIVRYRAIDMLRFQKVRKGNGLSEQELVSDSPTDSFQFTNKNQLDHCIEQLGIQQKQAIHLAFFDGLTHQEIAYHIDSPLGTSKSLIRRGVQALKRCLGL
ncbi:RNA polymerase sigma factor [Aliiglaciecola sp. M165]|uniref:RNA polymerase sigma factor n=1 Tax=Aliiglaciecola sp. M165 TaxID=2593649 RepID=UPI00117E256B|nr:sigma-70 family RNA polymerase sigma factor [Aliiglaciecola sp. M165]TRY31470.1 sigma-70 family RNA polymerase sigma factor [Aliiglaciecola sp. M165]